MKNEMIKELEKDELQIVSGGTIGETMNDSDLLCDLHLMSEPMGFFDAIFCWESSSAKVDAGWATVGVTCVSNPMNENKYFYKGLEITRTQARKIAIDPVIKGPVIG